MVTVALLCERLSERDQHSYPSWQISGEKACMETGPLLIAFDKDWGDNESAPNSLTRSLSRHVRLNPQPKANGNITIPLRPEASRSSTANNGIPPFSMSG